MGQAGCGGEGGPTGVLPSKAGHGNQQRRGGLAGKKKETLPCTHQPTQAAKNSSHQSKGLATTQSPPQVAAATTVGQPASYYILSYPTAAFAAKRQRTPTPPPPDDAPVQPSRPPLLCSAGSQASQAGGRASRQAGRQARCPAPRRCSPPTSGCPQPQPILLGGRLHGLPPRGRRRRREVGLAYEVGLVESQQHLQGRSSNRG